MSPVTSSQLSRCLFIAGVGSKELQGSKNSHEWIARGFQPALSYFTNAFNWALDKCAPFKRTRTKCVSTPWFTAELSNVFYSRNTAWALARCTKDPCHWLAFRQLRNKCTAAVRKANSDYYLHSFINSFYNPSKFRNNVKFTSDNSRTLLSAYVFNGVTQITNGHEICIAFSSHFAASCQLFDSLSVCPNSCVEDHRSSLLNTTTAEVNHCFRLSPVSHRMVAYEISTCKNQRVILLEILSTANFWIYNLYFQS